MEYEKQMILEDIELLNEGKNRYNDKDSSDDSNRKLKHKRKQIKISYDDEEDENDMYIEKKNYNVDVPLILPGFEIFANQVKTVGTKFGILPDIILKETPTSLLNISKKDLDEKTYNPNFIISKDKPFVSKKGDFNHKKGFFSYNPPKPDDPIWENENNNNNNNNNNINNDRNENNNNI
jgi:hypothetical protein